MNTIKTLYAGFIKKKKEGEIKEKQISSAPSTKYLQDIINKFIKNQASSFRFLKPFSNQIQTKSKPFSNQIIFVSFLGEFFFRFFHNIMQNHSLSVFSNQIQTKSNLFSNQILSHFWDLAVLRFFKCETILSVCKAILSFCKSAAFFQMRSNTFILDPSFLNN